MVWVASRNPLRYNQNILQHGPTISLGGRGDIELDICFIVGLSMSLAGERRDNPGTRQAGRQASRQAGRQAGSKEGPTSDLSPSSGSACQSHHLQQRPKKTHSVESLLQLVTPSNLEFVSFCLSFRLSTHPYKEQFVSQHSQRILHSRVVIFNGHDQRISRGKKKKGHTNNSVCGWSKAK